MKAYTFKKTLQFQKIACITLKKTFVKLYIDILNYKKKITLKVYFIQLRRKVKSKINKNGAWKVSSHFIRKQVNNQINMDAETIHYIRIHKIIIIDNATIQPENSH